MNTLYQMWGKTYQCQIYNAGGWFIGVRFCKFHDFSMTFDDFSKFHDFPWLFQKVLFFQVFQTLWEPWAAWGLNIPGKLGQYHDCWCLGSMHPWAISSHGTDYVGSTGPWLPQGRISTNCAMSVLRNDRKCTYMYTFLMFLQKNSAQKWFYLKFENTTSTVAQTFCFFYVYFPWLWNLFPLLFCNSGNKH